MADILEVVRDRDKQLTMDQIHVRRDQFQAKFDVLRAEEQDLHQRCSDLREEQQQLFKDCPHPDLKSEYEYGSFFKYCEDCGYVA
jgi:hypothetical protein